MQTDDLSTIRRQLSAMRMQAQALLEQIETADELLSEASTPELPSAECAAGTGTGKAAERRTDLCQCGHTRDRHGDGGSGAGHCGQATCYCQAFRAAAPGPVDVHTM